MRFGVIRQSERTPIGVLFFGYSCVLAAASAAVVATVVVTATAETAATAANEDENEDKNPSTAITAKTIITHIKDLLFCLHHIL